VLAKTAQGKKKGAGRRQGEKEVYAGQRRKGPQLPFTEMTYQEGHKSGVNLGLKAKKEPSSQGGGGEGQEAQERKSRKESRRIQKKTGLQGDKKNAKRSLHGKDIKQRMQNATRSEEKKQHPSLGKRAGKEKQGKGVKMEKSRPTRQSGRCSRNARKKGQPKERKKAFLKRGEKGSDQTGRELRCTERRVKRSRKDMGGEKKKKKVGWEDITGGGAKDEKSDGMQREVSGRGRWRNKRKPGRKGEKYAYGRKTQK